MNYTEYYPLCIIAVLAKVKGGLLNNNGEIARLQYETHLKLRDYGVFDPEGWEFEIDDSPIYNPKELSQLKPKKMSLVHPYYEDDKAPIPRDLEVLEVYKVHTIMIDTTKRRFNK